MAEPFNRVAADEGMIGQAAGWDALDEILELR
jgi:hypothetical protein